METEIQKSKFDYAALDIETREFVRQKETAIKARTAQTIIENGRDLQEVKERLEHGQFQDWIKANFPWSIDTAQRMMNVSEKFKKPQIADYDFAASALYLLAAPSTPDSARQEAVEKAESGEKITYTDAKELVEAHKQIEAQSQKITGLEKSIDALKGQLPTSDVLQKIEELKAELEAEKAKPAQTVEVEKRIEVEVEKIVEKIPDDYKELKDSVFDAKNKMRQAEANLELSKKRLKKLETQKANVEDTLDISLLTTKQRDEELSRLKKELDAPKDEELSRQYLRELKIHTGGIKYLVESIERDIRDGFLINTEPTNQALESTAKELLSFINKNENVIEIGGMR